MIAYSFAENGDGNMTEEERKRLEAIALSYEAGDEAPKVLATGKGYLAEKILERAKEENIPVHKDEKVANALADLEIGAYIPKELYEVVAEILVFVGDMDRIKGKITKKE